jgi:regulator of sigma E protease
LAAQKAKVEVLEFGFGYPPRAKIIGRRWGTIFSLNWIPFGGFVKILGENYDENDAEAANNSLPQQKRFTQVSKKWQAAILAAGVAFNILFAWFLFSLGFLIGLPAPAENDYGAAVKDPVLTIVEVLPDSPAKEVGLKSGDVIAGVSRGGNRAGLLEPAAVSDFISFSPEKVDLSVRRGEEILDFQVVPTDDLIEGKNIVGINMDMVGTLSFPPHKAIYEGGKATLRITYLTVAGIAGLVGDAVKGKGDISKITGPVGIVSLVGDASRLGFSYLITFTALISINLAIINLIPFPALDGGRIVFVAIEGATRKKINPKIAGVMNTVGFALLILLLLFVTYRDILKLF